MKFLEAHRLVQEFAGGDPTSLFLGMSGTADPLFLYLRAAGAERGLDLRPEAPSFGTLRQVLSGLSSRREDSTHERFILLPWDVIPELDWRTGFPADPEPQEQLLESARQFLEGIDPENLAQSYYLPAPLPPIYPNPEQASVLGHQLTALLGGVGAQIWPVERFSMGSHLLSGCPIGSPVLGEVAREIVDSLVPAGQEQRKVLVTDFDGVLWSGVIGEDGPEGIHCRPEGKGYRHFLYQSFLLKLRREGVLLAGVTRNDDGLVQSAFSSGSLSVAPDDFISVLASYEAKSAQIRRLAEALNLGLDSFVFVDDNPIELEEIARALPGVTGVPFPDSEAGMVEFFGTLAQYFAKDRVTKEDRARTTLYRRRLEGLAPSDVKGADLTTFLQTLDMQLEVFDRTNGARERAVQLINKTNQFNLNGIRRAEEEVVAMLEAGGALYSAKLTDRTGDHGEILSCLIDEQGRVRSLVLSCRVFQRRVEHRFLGWLAARTGGLDALEYKATERNEPLRAFLIDLGVVLPESEGWISLDPDAVASVAAESETLFAFREPEPR